MRRTWALAALPLLLASRAQRAEQGKSPAQHDSETCRKVCVGAWISSFAGLWAGLAAESPTWCFVVGAPTSSRPIPKGTETMKMLIVLMLSSAILGGAVTMSPTSAFAWGQRPFFTGPAAREGHQGPAPRTASMRSQPPSGYKHTVPVER